VAQKIGMKNRSADRTVDGAEYGIERLTKLAAAIRASSPRAMISACLEDLKTFGGEAPQGDDLTIMAIRWSGLSQSPS
jgi:serine phosphatase RsbU (regulator of sigma subunit)